MTQKEKALDILKHNKDAKLEHLLCFNALLHDDRNDLITFIEQFGDYMWNYYDTIVSYKGMATLEDKISEIYFMSDKVISEADIYEFFYWEHCNIMFQHIICKSMVCDTTEDIYENVEYHWSIDSMQDIYGYTDAQMYEIFGDAEVAEMFMSKS